MISVLMPAYNSETYIYSAIESVLNQSYDNFELIIVNDGSTDNTKDIILSFKDDRIKYFENEQNRGLTYTRNKLLSLSKGNYIAFLDSDDIAHQDRFKTQIHLIENQNYDFVAASSQYIDANNSKLNNKQIFNLNKDEILATMLYFNPIITSTVLFKKSILHNLNFREAYPPCEDYDLWQRLLLNCKAIVIPQILVKYRIHNSNISTVMNKQSKLNRNKVTLNHFHHYFYQYINNSFDNQHLQLVDFTLINNTNTVSDYVNKLITINKDRNFFP
ncbi:MAG: glycosyltransferase family 2 protein [Chitinophagales bacterium]